LRRALGEQTILSRGDEEVAVNWDAIACDVGSFEMLLDTNRLGEALDLYGGDLFTGFFIDEAPEFERWLASERARLRSLAARATLALSDRFEKAGDLTAAVGWARRSLDLSDTDESSLRKLIDLQSRAGDRTAANQTYAAFARHLAAEYQTEPSAETRSLIEQIRVGRPGTAPGAEPRSIGDGKRDREGSVESSFSERMAITGRRNSRREKILFAVAGIAVLISAGFVSWLMRPERSKQVLRYQLPIDSVERLAVGSGFAGRIAISPDGTRFAYISGSRNGPDQKVLRIRQRNDLHAKAIPRSEDAATPFFSPDGRSVGFLRDRSVWIVSPTGGPPIQVSDSLSGIAGASWGTDGYIYVDGFEAKPLVRVEAKPKAAAKWFTALNAAEGEMDHLWPAL
jgi:hypothetical protein